MALSDRVRYFHGLRMLVVGTGHMDNETLNKDLASDKFRCQWKNMIWLELKAWQHGRNLLDHDKWLVDKRKIVIPEIIEQINSFWFEVESKSREVSTQVTVQDILPCANAEYKKHALLNKRLSCLTQCYFDIHFKAFTKVNNLFEQLTYAEQLFSSNASLANDFPTYSAPHFQQKVALMCMWYNTSSELMHNVCSIMNMLGFNEYKSLAWPSSSNIMQFGHHASDWADNLNLVQPVSSIQLSDAVSKMTESYLRKYKVHDILSLLLRKHFGCIAQSHVMLKHVASGSVGVCGKTHPRCVKSLISKVQEELPEIDLHAPYDDLPQSEDYYGLPDMLPMYDFIHDFLFTIIGECLTLRLDQAVACQQQCGSTTSLLTMQQVVAECKEVIQCSLLTLSVHSVFYKPTSRYKQGDSHRKIMITKFNDDVFQMFHTYLDFVNLWIVAQLTGLPHAPRSFIDALQTEWIFARKQSVKIGVKSFIPCACKFIGICKKGFITTKDFIEAACIAIFGSNSNVEVFQASEYSAHQPREITTPSKPQAGILWFHRQRSESPHLARRHSSVFDNFQASTLHLSASEPTLCNNKPEYDRRYLFELSRAVRDLFEEVRERSLATINFAKTLRRDLESGIEFSFMNDNDACWKNKVKKISCKFCGFLQKIQANGFVNIHMFWRNDVKYQHGFHPSTHLLFVSGCIVNSNQDNEIREVIRNHNLLQYLLSCATSAPFGSDYVGKNDGILLIVRKKNVLISENCECAFAEEGQCSGSKLPNQKLDRFSCWKGPQIYLNELDIMKTGTDISLALSKNLVLIHDITAVAKDGYDVGRRRKELCKVFGDKVKLEIAQSSVLYEINTSFQQLHQAILLFCELLIQEIDAVGRYLQKQVEFETCCETEDDDQLFLEIHRVVQKNFNFGFECLKETIRLFSGSFRYKIEDLEITYAKTWMKYIIGCMPRGKGQRPTWSSMGLNFLTSIPLEVIKRMNDDEYANLKTLISNFIDHLIGSRHHSNKVLPISECAFPATVYRSLSSHSSSDASYDFSEKITETLEETSCDTATTSLLLPSEQVLLSIQKMELLNNQKRFEAGIVGRVVDVPDHVPFFQLSIRSVGFQWQRGNKIGEGSFGRVFTCVDMDSGKILAMKEINFQAHDEQRIKEALDEITNFEGITHPNLVKYHGVELHRDQMFIFMDYCDSGTLEEVSRIGLPEVMIQQYTAQLVSAISVLHDQGFVHRDIKGSNVFLTSSGLLKLGDFGSAVRLINRTRTVTGEIASHHGITAAYTAPEVINSIEQRGYGRKADIWSLGCVVIEMATGKRPWHDHEPFQILYKVGMGSKPAIPVNLSGGGQSFVGHCLEVEPALRWNINELQSHTFVKVAQPEMYPSP